MKIGDLVKDWDTGQKGIVINMILHSELPPVARVLWEDGEIVKGWAEELELIRESR